MKQRFTVRSAAEARRSPFASLPKELSKLGRSTRIRRTSRQLIAENGTDYVRNFQYSILEVRTHLTTPEETVVRREAYWKDVLATRMHGYNAN